MTNSRNSCACSDATSGGPRLCSGSMKTSTRGTGVKSVWRNSCTGLASNHGKSRTDTSVSFRLAEAPLAGLALDHKVRIVRRSCGAHQAFDDFGGVVERDV